MSTYNGGGPQNVTVTYQFVVVAVVACGMFAAGVITIMYRRRRRQLELSGHHVAFSRADWGFAPSSDPTRFAIDPTGALVEAPRKKKKIGPVPKIWDAEIGRDSDSEEEEEMEEKGKLGWKPTALAIPSNIPTTLDATVVIAMPHPSLSFNPDDPCIYDPPVKETTYNEWGEEEVDIPPIQLGVAHLPIDGDWAAIEELKPKPPPPRSSSPSRRARRVRVDGFSRGLLRLP